jgi:rod shape-determining protein MreD
LKAANRNANGIIWASLVVALALTIWTLPDAMAPFRPEWTALAIIYWVMALPNRVNVGVAWLAGLGLDALTGSVLGQHALAMCLLAYLVTWLHLQIRVFPVWQQALTVMALLAVYELVLILVEGSLGQLYGLEWRWAPVVTGMLLWPWTMALLRHLRRRFQVA